jgi:hypothetical protein
VANGELRLAVAGLAGMMLAEVPQVLSGFLPSPSTAYDKASGGIETGPESMRVLQRSKVKGTIVTVIMAGSVSLMAYIVIGWNALWLFAAAMAILWLFLNDFNSAMRLGAEHANGGRA